jgi:hypothetical protein
MVQQMASAAIVVAALFATPSQRRNADAAAGSVSEQAVKRLADEVREKGWLVFSARSEKGDWDLFLCRPDGSALRNITRTPAHHEAVLFQEGKLRVCLVFNGGVQGPLEPLAPQPEANVVVSGRICLQGCHDAS